MEFLYSFEQACQKIGYKDWRGAMALFKEKHVLDSKRCPLPPYRYQGLFKVRDVVVNGITVKQTMLTNKGVDFLYGAVIFGARKKTTAIRGRDNGAEQPERTASGTETGARTSA